MINKTLPLIMLFICMALYTFAQDGDPSFGVVIFSSELVTPGISPDIPNDYIFSDPKTFAFLFSDDVGYAIAANRVQIPERDLIGVILDELSIDSSGLADPNMQTKLGRIVLGAFFVFTYFTVDEDKAVVSIRAIATETGEVVYCGTVIANEKEDKNNDPTVEGKKAGNRIYEAISRYANEHVINIQEKK